MNQLKSIRRTKNSWGRGGENSIKARYKRVGNKGRVGGATNSNVSNEMTQTQLTGDAHPRYGTRTPRKYKLDSSSWKRSSENDQREGERQKSKKGRGRRSKIYFSKRAVKKKTT